MDDSKKHTIEVWGDLACFSRPEMKVERFSYPIITPSAARGIFDAIYWEGVRNDRIVYPYFHWQVELIEILKMPRYIALRRNEVKGKIPCGNVKNWMSGKKLPEPLWADSNNEEMSGRTQRQTMALKDVHYRITSYIVPKAKFSSKEYQNKFNETFERRAKKGKCFQQPFFGCSEFPAFFKYLPVNEGVPQPASFDQHIGWMLYDVFDLKKNIMEETKPFISVFDANCVNGKLMVPPFESEAVRKPWKRLN